MQPIGGISGSDYLSAVGDYLFWLALLFAAFWSEFLHIRHQNGEPFIDVGRESYRLVALFSQALAAVYRFVVVLGQDLKPLLCLCAER
jgi:hypothetical protein